MQKVVIVGLYHDYDINTDELKVKRVRYVTLNELAVGMRWLPIHECEVGQLIAAVTSGQVEIVCGKVTNGELDLIGGEQRYYSYGYAEFQVDTSYSRIKTGARTAGIREYTVFYTLIGKITKNKLYVFVSHTGEVKLFTIDGMLALLNHRRAFISNGRVTGNAICLLEGTLQEVQTPMDWLYSFVDAPGDHGNPVNPLSALVSRAVLKDALDVDRLIDSLLEIHKKELYTNHYLVKLAGDTIIVDGSKRGYVDEHVRVGGSSKSYKLILTGFKCRRMDIEVIPDSKHSIMLNKCVVRYKDSYNRKEKAVTGSVTAVLNSEALQEGAEVCQTELHLDTCIISTNLLVSGIDRVALAATLVEGDTSLSDVDKIKFCPSVNNGLMSVMSVLSKLDIAPKLQRPIADERIPSVLKSEPCVIVRKTVSMRVNSDTNAVLPGLARELIVTRVNNKEDYNGIIYWDTAVATEAFKKHMQAMQTFNTYGNTMMPMVELSKECLQAYKEFGTVAKIRTGKTSTLKIDVLRCDKVYTESIVAPASVNGEVYHEYK